MTTAVVPFDGFKQLCTVDAVRVYRIINYFTISDHYLISTCDSYERSEHFGRDYYLRSGLHLVDIIEAYYSGKAIYWIDDDTLHKMVTNSYYNPFKLIEGKELDLKKDFAKTILRLTLKNIGRTLVDELSEEESRGMTTDYAMEVFSDAKNNYNLILDPTELKGASYVLYKNFLNKIICDQFTWKRGALKVLAECLFNVV